MKRCSLIIVTVIFILFLLTACENTESGINSSKHKATVSTTATSADRFVSQDDFLLNLQNVLEICWKTTGSTATPVDYESDEFKSYYKNLINVEYEAMKKYTDSEFIVEDFQKVVYKYLTALQQLSVITNNYPDDENSFTEQWDVWSNQRKEAIADFYKNYNLEISPEFDYVLEQWKIVPKDIASLLQGTWVEKDREWMELVIDGYDVNIIYYYDEDKSRVSDIYERELSLDDDGNLVFESGATGIEYNVSIVDNTQIIVQKITNDVGNYLRYYTKISENTIVPEEAKAPAIGMSKSEVEKSTWGQPNKINKTTTAAGVTEQWVYKDALKNKYIYFDNGYVTAIQE